MKVVGGGVGGVYFLFVFCSNVSFERFTLLVWKPVLLTVTLT